MEVTEVKGDRVRVGHCPACGADLWNSTERFGHLLGCGASLNDPNPTRDRKCPAPRVTQQKILAEALEEAFGEAPARPQADVLAEAIRNRLTVFAGLTEDERARFSRGEGRPNQVLGEELPRELDRIRARVQELEAMLSSHEGSGRARRGGA